MVQTPPYLSSTVGIRLNGKNMEVDLSQYLRLDWKLLLYSTKPRKNTSLRTCVAEHLVDILHSVYFNSFNLKDYFHCYFTYFIYDHKHSSACDKRMSRQYGMCCLIGIAKSCIEVESTLETSAYLVCYKENISFSLLFEGLHR